MIGVPGVFARMASIRSSPVIPGIQSLLPAPGEEGPVSLARKDRAQDLALVPLVVDDEDGPLHLRAAPRKEDADVRSPPRLRIYHDFAAMGLHDLPGEDQPEAQPGGFGREVRLENPLPVPCRDSHAGG